MTTAVATQAETPPQTVRRSALQVMSQRFDVDPQMMLSVLKKTVIKTGRGKSGPSNEEVCALVVVANEYGLNPLTREIHAFESNGAIVPIVGIDGWARIVNRQADFDGCDFEVNEDEKGNLVSVTCEMHVKDRSHPIRVTEYFVECKRNTAPWNQMPRRMLRHKAFMQAARVAFGLAGIYDEDEARDIVRNERKQAANSRDANELNDKLRAQLEAPSDEPDPVEEHELQDEAQQQADPEETPELSPLEKAVATAADILGVDLDAAEQELRDQAEVELSKSLDDCEVSDFAHLLDVLKGE